MNFCFQAALVSLSLITNQLGEILGKPSSKLRFMGEGGVVKDLMSNDLKQNYPESLRRR